MNIQNMLKKAQEAQKGMMNEQKIISEMVFETKKSLITVKMNGSKEVIEVKIEAEEIKNDEMELLEDMILLAVNDLLEQIEEETNKRMGKYTQGLPGVF